MIQLTSKSFNSHKMTSNKVDVAVDLESPEFSSPESVTAKASPFYCYIVSSGNKTYAGNIQSLKISQYLHDCSNFYLQILLF